MRTTRGSWHCRPQPWARILCLVCVLGLALALAGCGANATDAALGAIQGTVTAGPTCPVETVENPCPPKPVADREVDLQTPDGSTVETTHTDSAGKYHFSADAGSYVVHVQIVPGEVGMRQTTPGNVTVAAGQTVTLDIQLDTGIR